MESKECKTDNVKILIKTKEKRSMKKRLLSLLVCAGMVGSMLTGCGGSGGASGGTQGGTTQAASAQAGTEAGTKGQEASGEAVELTFWSMAQRKDFEDKIIAAFTEKNPQIKITPTYYSTDDIKANLKVAASSGTLPDMWYNWGGSLASYYPANGLTYDFTEYAKEHNWDDKYLASSLELCTLEGQLSGIPQSVAMMNLWYRQDIFKQFNLEVPKTFEELETVCETLKAGGVIPFATGGQYGWHVMRYIQDLLEYYGGAEEHDGLNNMTTDWGTSEAVTKAFAKFKEWTDKGYFNEGFLTEDPNDCRMYLYNGTCAMIIDSPTMASQILNAEQDTSLYSFFAFPTESNGDGSGRMAAYVKMTQVNKNVTDAQLDAIVKFWDFYYSADENPEFSNIEQPIALKGAQLPESLAIADGVMELMDACGIYTQMDQALPAQVADQMFAAQDNVVIGNMKPEEVGASVQTAIQSYLAENQ